MLRLLSVLALLAFAFGCKTNHAISCEQEDQGVLLCFETSAASCGTTGKEVKSCGEDSRFFGTCSGKIIPSNQGKIQGNIKIGYTESAKSQSSYTESVAKTKSQKTCENTLKGKWKAN